MRNVIKAIALGIGICLACTACGTGVTMIALVSPSISQVSPQVVTAGTASVTVTVQGTNFQTQAALTVNGAAVPTTVVNSTTLAAKISGSTLAAPAVAQLQVQNSDGAKSNQVSLTVTGAPSTPTSLSIGTVNLPAGQAGSAYSASLTATGGTPGYSWAVTSGALPAGVTLSSTGVLSGTPTASGTSTFAVTVSDSSSPAQQQTVTLSIVISAAPVTPATLAVGSAALGSGKVGAAYTATLSASGGTPGYTWAVTSGSLPAGLTLSSSGMISGTPTASGSYTFTVTVTDSGSPAQTASASESITVSASSLSINSGGLGSAKYGSAYTASLSASGGTPGYTWAVTSGSLPAGLTLSSAGVISGTPTASGSYTFTVTVTDSGSPAQTASASESITVSASSLSINSGGLGSAKYGSAYTASLSASGGTPGYTWAVTSGSLPAGLTLSSAGVISGTPTASGSYTFTVTVTDSGSPAQTASASESIAVSASSLSINSGGLAAGKSGSAYSASLSASGGTPGYTWVVTSGSLPAGLTLSSAGVISGTPTAIGTANFTVTVTDSGSPAQTASASESITVGPPTLTITSGQLGEGREGAAYNADFSATGGTPGYTWALTSGSLPAGLTMSSTGVISGSPTAIGTSNFTVTVTDSGSPAQTASLQESLSISAALLVITTPSLASGTSGTSYTSSLSASGGTPTYSWSIATGSLPAGLTLSSLGVISGTPTTPGTFTFTAEVSDNGSPVQTASAALSITIATTHLTVTTTSLVDAETTFAYSANLGASGGTPNYTWTIASGSLPAGLTLSSAGVISGTPTAAGVSNFSVSVKDSGSPVQTASLALTLTVEAAPDNSNPGTTWYVRPDGGTRYSSNMPQGQCDGKGDQSYAAAVAANGGVAAPNLHCAFNDVRLMYGDGSYNDGVHFPGYGWVMQGGDTLIIRGSISTGVTYRIGWASYNNAFNCSGAYPINGLCGNPFSSWMPPPPAGTAGQPTRILGENYKNCSAQGARTALWGGASVYDVLDLAGASYVDVECLDISDFSQCDQCTTNDDKATNGIQFSNTTTNTTLSNIRVHGIAYNGIYGPTGDGVVLNNIDIIGNHSAGWDTDDGTAGVGHLTITNYSILWNGCVEEYPIVDALPYFACRDDDSEGYGDGFGTATVSSPAPGWQIHFDQGVVAYNTQDGLDGLHVSGPGSSMTVTRTLAYGNMGQQIKIGASPTLQNDLIVGNCDAMQSAIPGTPAGYNQYLSDYCRAADTAIALMIGPQNPIVYQNNTLFSKNLVGLEIEYLQTPTGTETIQYNNNLMVGFLNSLNQGPSILYSNTNLNEFTNPGSSYTNNLTYGEKAGIPCPAPGEVSGLCTDPGLVDETWHPYGYGDMSPLATGNAVVGAGVALPGVTVDYTGQTRGNPPTIGAYESSH